MSKPFVLIKLDKEREVRMSNKANILFEEMTEKSIIEAFQEMSSGKMSVKLLNQLLFVGLKSRDNDITYEEVIDLVDEYGNAELVMTTVTKAMEEANFFASTIPKKEKKS